MVEQDPRLQAALRNAQRETADAVSSLRAMAADIRREHEQFKRGRDRRREDRAKAAREGELGPDLQRLQQRVDLRQTTWEDAVDGRDNHPSAAVARQNVQRYLSDIAEEVAQDPDFVEESLAARRTEARVRAERED